MDGRRIDVTDEAFQAIMLGQQKALPATMDDGKAMPLQVGEIAVIGLKSHCGEAPVLQVIVTHVEEIKGIWIASINRGVNW